MNPWMMTALSAAVVVLLAALIFVSYRLYRLKKLANKTMEQVDDMLEQLLLGHKVTYFPQNEDSLLGKFQTQAERLYEVYHSHERREQQLRAQISSSVSDLVHQINTPIANIKMYSEFLKDGGLSPEEYQHFADNLEKQAQKLGWLGESFSRLSRLETGIISLQPKVQPVLPVLLSAIDQVSPKAEQRRNDICLTGDQRLEAYLDKKWTEEVFFNLLDNAVKYSDPGSPILVELLAYETYVRINVCSRGIRIEREEFPKLFRRFYRGAAAKDQEGIGLGLYLARQIVKDELGYMKGEADEQRGNVFSVFLRRTI